MTEQVTKKTAQLTEHLDPVLLEKVVGWFRKRQLHNGNPFKQYEKFREETEEILDSIKTRPLIGSDELEEQKAEFIDAIGDTLVVMIGILTQTMKGKGIETLVVYPALTNDSPTVRLKELVERVSNTYTEDILDLKKVYDTTIITHSVDGMRAFTSDYIFSTTDNVEVNENKTSIYTMSIMNSLRDILSLGSNFFNDETLNEMTLNDCLELAYKVIEHRVGLYKNGKFIKQADFTPEQQAEFDSLEK